MTMHFPKPASREPRGVGLQPRTKRASCYIVEPPTQAILCSTSTSLTPEPRAARRDGPHAESAGRARCSPAPYASKRYVSPPLLPLGCIEPSVGKNLRNRRGIRYTSAPKLTALDSSCASRLQYSETEPEKVLGTTSAGNLIGFEPVPA